MGLREDHSQRNQRLAWVLSAAVAAAAALLQATGLRAVLAWERAGLSEGELWRLVSGHFVHLGWSHLLLNVAGLALVAWIVGRAFDGTGWLVITLVSIAAIDAGFWFLDPGLEWYVGLSGLLHGLLGAGLVAGTMRRETESVVLALLVAAKLCWEQFVGPLPGSEGTSGGAVIVDAHLYGALGGVLAAAMLWHRVGREPPI